MSNFLGINSSGLALITDQVTMCWPIPKAKSELQTLFEAVVDDEATITRAVIETGETRYGGFLRRLLIAAGIPFEEVTRESWQAACLKPGENALSAAQRLFQYVKVDRATAGALLLAHYGRTAGGAR